MSEKPPENELPPVSAYLEPGILGHITDIMEKKERKENTPQYKVAQLVAQVTGRIIDERMQDWVSNQERFNDTAKEAYSIAIAAQKMQIKDLSSLTREYINHRIEGDKSLAIFKEMEFGDADKKRTGADLMLKAGLDHAKPYSSLTEYYSWQKRILGEMAATSLQETPPKEEEPPPEEGSIIEFDPHHKPGDSSKPRKGTKQRGRGKSGA